MSSNEKPKISYLTIATNRLNREYCLMKTTPDPSFVAEHLPRNIFDWRFVMRGGDGTPFAGGYYYGRLKFPVKFPFEPPALYIITPNGRFSHEKLCLDVLISNYRKEECYPMVHTSDKLACLMGVMCEDVDDYNYGVGTLETTDEDKQEFAYKSLEFNLGDKLFCELFPDIVIEIKTILANRRKEEDAKKLDNEKELDDISVLVLWFWKICLKIKSIVEFSVENYI